VRTRAHSFRRVSRPQGGQQVSPQPLVQGLVERLSGVSKAQSCASRGVNGMTQEPGASEWAACW
jgi:hypothetical protein